MTCLLLAKAGQIAGKRPGSLAWQTWPVLLTAERLALLDSADESGSVDKLKEQAILEWFRCRPPAQDGENIVGAFISEEMGFPFEFPEYRVPTYNAATYQNWPVRDWPMSPFIAAWTAATAGQDEPAPRDGANPAKRTHTQDRADQLAAVLDTIDARARESGIPLDRSQWPGTKAELRAFLEWCAPHLLWALPTDNDRLSDELRPMGVAFARPGRAKDKGQRFYKALFPDYPA